MIKVLVLVGLVAIDESSEHNANKIEIIIELSEEWVHQFQFNPSLQGINQILMEDDIKLRPREPR